MKKLRDIEKKFYEIIGIKVFRKMAFSSRRILYSFKKMSKKEREEILSAPGNYYMKKGHGIQDLCDFKEELKYNTIVHLSGIVLCICGIIYALPRMFYTASFIYFIFGIVNAYCVMLQRYNLIRIHEAEEKYEKLQKLRKKRKSKMKEKENTLERINELIDLFNLTPSITNKLNDVTKMQEETKLENTQADNPLDPSYWEKPPQENVKVLGRKLR